MKRGYQTLYMLGLVVLCFFSTAQAQPKSFWPKQHSRPQRFQRQQPAKSVTLYTHLNTPTQLPRHYSSAISRQSVTPLGINWQRKISPRWDLAFLLEYEFLGLSSPQGSHNTFDDKLLTMDSTRIQGQGISGAVQLIGNYLDQDFVIQPFFHLWDVQRFVTDEGYQSRFRLNQDRNPGQKIHEYGVLITWRF